jgi:hypothetical protein
VVTWQQIPRPSLTAAPWLVAFQFFAYLLCYPLQRAYSPIAEVSVVWGLLTESLQEIFANPVLGIPCSWVLLRPDTGSIYLLTGLLVRISQGFRSVSISKPKSYKACPSESGIDKFMPRFIQYVFFWVFPRRLSANSRRFGTLYRFHLQRQVNEV